MTKKEFIELAIKMGLTTSHGEWIAAKMYDALVSEGLLLTTQSHSKAGDS